MKRQIRRNVFETNSSSTHAICISNKSVAKEDIPTFVKFNHGKFGWEFEENDSISDRAAYLYQAICEVCYYDDKTKSEYMDSLRSALSKYGVTCEFDSYDKDDDSWEVGYIDHGSETREFVDSVMNSDERLIRYLFGNSIIITGNDNSDDYEEYMSTHNFDDYEVFYKGN